MTTTQYHHFNPVILLEAIGDDKEIFITLLRIFLSEGEEKFPYIRAAAESGDLKQLEYQSHSLKGTVGPIGAEVLTHLLQSIESEAGKHQTVCSMQRLTELEQELAHTRCEVLACIAEYGA